MATISTTTNSNSKLDFSMLLNSNSNLAESIESIYDETDSEKTISIEDVKSFFDTCSSEYPLVIGEVHNGNRGAVEKVAKVFFRKEDSLESVDKWNAYYPSPKNPQAKQYACAYYSDSYGYYPEIAGRTFHSRLGDTEDKVHAMMAQAQFISEGYFHEDLFAVSAVNPGNFVLLKSGEKFVYFPIDIGELSVINENDPALGDLRKTAKKILETPFKEIVGQYTSTKAGSLKNEFRSAISKWQENRLPDKEIQKVEAGTQSDLVVNCSTVTQTDQPTKPKSPEQKESFLEMLSWIIRMLFSWLWGCFS